MSTARMRENARAIAFLKYQAKKHAQIRSFLLRGSNAYGAEQVPGWSDIDTTMVVKDSYFKDIYLKV